jgi:hypothetical protein
MFTKTRHINTKTVSSLGVALLTLSLGTSAFAGTDFSKLSNLNQGEFNKLASDFTTAASYKSISPATPMGITGFDLGAELSVTQLSDSAVWRKAGSDVSSLIIPKLHVQKGLPFNIDLGASLSYVPNSDIKLFGAEARYALLEGSAATPALAVRAAFSNLSGVNQIGLNTKSLEMVASKGFVMLTPYVGVGKVWGSVTPNVGGLQKTSPTSNKIFAGINANLGLINLAAEVDRTGDNQTISAKLGFRW